MKQPTTIDWLYHVITHKQVTKLDNLIIGYVDSAALLATPAS